MKLTEQKLKQIIKEVMDQPCEDIHPNTKQLILSGDKDYIIQGFELFSTLTELDIELKVHGGEERNKIPDPRVHLDVEGPDVQKFIECFHVDKLVSTRALEKFKKSGRVKLKFIPTGMRYSVFAKHFGGP